MGEKKRYWTGARKAPAQDKFFIEALDPDLWTAGDKDNWDACWHTGMPAPSVFKSMKPGQAVNHIPGNNALTVKSKLYETLYAARERLAGDGQRARFSFFPRSFLMPGDYHTLQREAYHNPDKKWIVKPKRLSRGRGISVHQDAATVPNDAKWLAQEYLADAHLYDGFKYVLRCYVLISSVEPLRVYLYKDGFVKLASEPYRHGDYDNLYAHLTNPDVNALNEDADAPVVFHSFETYRNWLKRAGADPDALFAGVRDIAVLTAIAACEQMRERIASSGAGNARCFELIGLDCMVDNALKPWLLECNLSPSLEVCAEPETGGAEEEATKRALVADLVSLVGLNRAPEPPADRPDKKQFVSDAARELENAGGFERIFPGPDAAEFLSYFPVPRYADVALAGAVSEKPAPQLSLQPADAQSFVIDGELALFSGQTGQFRTPNEARSFIWLKISDGAAPDAVAEELASLTGASDTETDALRKEVWDAVCDWSQKGLLTARQEQTSPPAEAPADISETWRRGEGLRMGGKTIRLRYGAEEIHPRLEPLTAPLRAAAKDPAAEIEILCGKIGYAVAKGPQLVRSGLRLAQIAEAMRNILLDDYAADNPELVCLDASLCASPQGAILFASNARGGWDGLAVSFATSQGGDFLSGACALGHTPGEAKALPSPARVGEKSAEGESHGPHIQEWGDGVRGYLVPYKEENVGRANEPVRAVIIPVFDPDAGAAEFREKSGRDGLLALAATRRGAAPLSLAAAGRLYDWREAVPVFELHYRRADDGSRALAQKLADIPAK